MPPHDQRRTAFPEPKHLDSACSIPQAPQQVHDVIFRHPAYDDRSNIILMLPALDHPDAALDYNTTLAACAVVANNAWRGFFTLDRAGEQRVAPAEDGLLRERSYYFRVGLGRRYSRTHRCLPALVDANPLSEKYPVVLGFNNWTFPDALPDAWTRTSLVSSQPPTGLYPGKAASQRPFSPAMSPAA